MLIIARRGKESLVRAIFEKWDVPCVEIGRVSEDGMMRVRDNGATVAAIPARALAEEAPLYSREAQPVVTAIDDRGLADLGKIDNREALRQLLRDPTIASKNWVYRQYDHTVRTGTLVKPGSDAAVFFVRYANKILAATTDCNSLYCALDPREGGKIAVAEAARNLTCSGARPLAVTDNLNFGNPYKAENFWQLREAVEGIAEACRAFGTPVTGGNVSLYNESPAGVVDPTPTIGMVGLIDKEEHVTTQWFKNDGDTVILIGEIAGTVIAGVDREEEGTDGNKAAEVVALGQSLGGSRYLKVCHGLKLGPPPRVNLAHEIKIQNAVRDLIREGMVNSAHDCSEGGLAVALAECCFNPEKLFGAEIDVTRGSGLRSERERTRDACASLFNESQSRIVISVAPENVEKSISVLRERGVPFQQLGKVGGDQLGVRIGNENFSWPVCDLHADWWTAIRRAVESDSAAEGIPSL
jgi:phosphoribosylformylglycinamidine synthase